MNAILSALAQKNIFFNVSNRDCGVSLSVNYSSQAVVELEFHYKPF
ncbi:MAG: hypothetical protein J07HQW2_02619 [Haloquadratum walsbyi J07HQW2]|uniref:Uncharacterized protein n=1 Tax=Haloquadratum walsbyi J07HQW2 TaxID=1238425 RepID=U1N039_9EURY|nr:MAG: hypothetical protein J07HQW2_02619 [Haloquadratum walsbyi J07HQW2]